MPYKYESDKLLIPKNKDKRIKLTDIEKLEIYNLYTSGNYSQRKLANLYSVSRRLIQFIVNQDSKEKNLKAREDRGGSKIYYKKEKNTKYIKEHRRYKQELYLNGKLINKD